MSRAVVEREEPALASTAAHLLDVAERLFAQRGIDTVSLREIVRESGQSNLSAAHYHFGSRDALMGALLARRIRAINAVRHQRLDALEAQGRADQVHAIVSATVSSLGDAVKTQPWGPDYVRVAAQVLMVPSSAAVVFLDPDTMSGQIRCREMLRRILPHLPSQVFMDRSRILNSETTYGIARWIDAHGAVTGANSRRFSALIRNMSDFLAAGFAAPVGEPADTAAIARSARREAA